MLPDRVTNPGLLTYESGALPIALRDPAIRDLSKGYTMLCLPVHGDNPRALASRLPPIQADNLWYSCFIPAS